MSKKVLIIGAIVVAVIAALPFFGNMSVEKMIGERIAMLNENGVKVESRDNGSNYLTTNTHYEFTLADQAAFQNYLNTLSDAQIPSYVQAMLDDVVMAVDISYSNLLFNDDVAIDLYPVALSKEAGERMKAEDGMLYDQMQQMLENREFIYHMEYNAANASFKGNIKDIEREIAFQDGKKAKIVFDTATFDGKGSLMEPESVHFRVKRADVDFSLPEEATMRLAINGLESQSSFSAKNSFDLLYKAEKIHFLFADKENRMAIEGSQMEAVSDSKVKEGKIETKINAAIKEFSMTDNNGSIQLQNLTFIMDADNIDEAAYEAFQKASEQAGASSQYTMLASLGVVSKGFDLHVKRFSVEKIAIKDSALMNGFDHTADLSIKADESLIQKMQITPMALMQNIDINARLQFASDFYAFIKKQGNMGMVDGFAKQEGQNIVFDVVLRDGRLQVNGQSL